MRIVTYVEVVEIYSRLDEIVLLRFLGDCVLRFHVDRARLNLGLFADVHLLL